MLASKHRPALVSPAKAARWTELLIESDRHYFTAGATPHRVAGVEVVVMPSFARYPVGAVGFVDDPEPILSGPRAWRDEIVALCAARRASQVRLYTSATDSRLTTALTAAGLSSSIEIAMAAYVERVLNERVERDSAFRLREVTTEERWRSKRQLHERTPERPDGKSIDAGSWVRLERAKVDAGYMSAWLIERDGVACGAFGLSFRPEMVRFKNFFIAPEHRRCGAASAAMRLIAREAAARDTQALGCFVLPGGRGARVYEGAGLTYVGKQIEWTLPLAESTELPRARARDALA